MWQFGTWCAPVAVGSSSDCCLHTSGVLGAEPCLQHLWCPGKDSRGTGPAPGPSVWATRGCLIDPPNSMLSQHPIQVGGIIPSLPSEGIESKLHRHGLASVCLATSPLRSYTGPASGLWHLQFLSYPQAAPFYPCISLYE